MPTRPWGLRDERGVTLIEIAVAVAVIAIGLMSVAAVIPVSSSAVQEGGQLSTAAFLAEQTIERARAAAWSEEPALDCLGVSPGDAAPLPTGATCHGAATTQFPDDDATGHPGYQRTLRVSSCEKAPGCAGVIGEGLRRAVVTVRYTPLATGGGAPPAPRAIQLEWLASRR